MITIFCQNPGRDTRQYKGRDVGREAGRDAGWDAGRDVTFSNSGINRVVMVKNAFLVMSL